MTTNITMSVIKRITSRITTAVTSNIRISMGKYMFGTSKVAAFHPILAKSLISAGFHLSKKCDSEILRGI